MKGAVNRMRARVGGPLDRPAPEWLVRALRREPPPHLELSRVESLGRAPLEQVRDRERLEAVVPDLSIIDAGRSCSPTATTRATPSCATGTRVRAYAPVIAYHNIVAGVYPGVAEVRPLSGTGVAVRRREA